MCARKQNLLGIVHLHQTQHETYRKVAHSSSRLNRSKTKIAKICDLLGAMLSFKSSNIEYRKRALIYMQHLDCQTHKRVGDLALIWPGHPKKIGCNNLFQLGIQCMKIVPFLHSMNAWSWYISYWWYSDIHSDRPVFDLWGLYVRCVYLQKQLIGISLILSRPPSRHVSRSTEGP